MQSDWIYCIAFCKRHARHVSIGDKNCNNTSYPNDEMIINEILKKFQKQFDLKEMDIVKIIRILIDEKYILVSESFYSLGGTVRNKYGDLDNITITARLTDKGFIYLHKINTQKIAMWAIIISVVALAISILVPLITHFHC